MLMLTSGVFASDLFRAKKIPKFEQSVDPKPGMGQVENEIAALAVCKVKFGFLTQSFFVFFSKNAFAFL